MFRENKIKNIVLFKMCISIYYDDMLLKRVCACESNVTTNVTTNVTKCRDVTTEFLLSVVTFVVTFVVIIYSKQTKSPYGARTGSDASGL